MTANAAERTFLIEKCLRNQIELFTVILKQLEDEDSDCRKEAQYCAVIMLDFIDGAIKHINSNVYGGEMTIAH